jgi:hypothetical protein
MRAAQLSPFLVMSFSDGLRRTSSHNSVSLALALVSGMMSFGVSGMVFLFAQLA